MPEREENMDMKICQSCGMPMQEDAHFGKNVDGTKSEIYCCYCMQDGVLGECTLEEMIDICAEIDVKDGRCKTLEEAKKLQSQYLPTLERWKKC